VSASNALDIGAVLASWERELGPVLLEHQVEVVAFDQAMARVSHDDHALARLVDLRWDHLGHELAAELATIARLRADLTGPAGGLRRALLELGSEIQTKWISDVFGGP